MSRHINDGKIKVLEQNCLVISSYQLKMIVDRCCSLFLFLYVPFFLRYQQFPLVRDKRNCMFETEKINK